MKRREETTVHILFSPEELVKALSALEDVEDEIPPGALVRPKWSPPNGRPSKRKFLGVEVSWPKEKPSDG